MKCEKCNQELYELGRQYYEGIIVPQDFQRAMSLFTDVAKQNHARSMNMIAEMYNQGEGVEQDYDKADEWYRKAYENGDGVATVRMAELCLEELGTNGAKESRRLYKHASTRLMEEAKSGDTESQFELGVLYGDGRGVEQNIEKAFSLIKRAAIGGYHEAVYMLAVFYKDGVGTRVDEACACEWFIKAHGLGNLDAAYELGGIYKSRNGSLVDLDSACEWFTKAHEQGNDDAASEIALLLLRKWILGERNTGEATRWFNIAFEQGCVCGEEFDFTHLHLEGVRDTSCTLASDFSTKEIYESARKFYEGKRIPQDNTKALILFMYAASQNHARSMKMVGEMLGDGKGTSQSYEAAAKWYRKAMECGDGSAMGDLAYLYLKGLGVKQDKVESDRLYSLALARLSEESESGDIEAKVELASLYWEGLGVEKNLTKAFALIENAALRGHCYATFFLGSMYRDGIGTEMDLEKALKWYMKAHERGNPDAASEISCIYACGTISGVDNNHEAGKWFNIAAEQGRVCGEKWSNLANMIKSQKT